MANKRRIGISLISVAVIGAIFILTSRMQAQQKREALLDRLSQGGYGSGSVRTNQEEDQWQQQMAQLNRLWAEREQPEILPRLLPLLESPFSDIRIRVVQRLGVLENPGAEAPLQAILKTQKEMAEKHLSSTPPGFIFIPPIPVQLALARIRSRHLKGPERVDAVVQAVGLSTADLKALSERLNRPATRFLTSGSQGEMIMEEIVDLLVTMRQRGEDVTALVQPLTLNPEQKVRLETVALTPAQQAQRIIAYIKPLQAVGVDDLLMIDRLVELGPPAHDLVLAELKAMQQYPEPFRKGRGYVILFRAAARAGDHRALPVFQHFLRDTDQWVSRYAAQAISTLEEKRRWREKNKPDEQ